MTKVSKKLHTPIGKPAISGNLLKSIHQSQTFTLAEFQQEWNTQVAGERK